MLQFVLVLRRATTMFGTCRQEREIRRHRGASSRPQRRVRPDRLQKVTGKFLRRHIMHDLVIRPLRKVEYRATTGFHALCRHTGSKGHGMLLGDADVIDPIRNSFSNAFNPVPPHIAGGDRDDALCLMRDLIEGIHRHAGVAGTHGFFAGARPFRAQRAGAEAWNQTGLSIAAWYLPFS